MPRSNTLADVFTKIDMHGGDTSLCWEWKGKVNAKDGRPYFTTAGKRRPAYSVALEAYAGPATEDILDPVARHSCDNKRCCNPTHLEWGTKQDNSNDMVERERHGLPATVIRAIRKLLGDDSNTQQHIANLYGISRETVSSIATGRAHKDKD